MKILTSLLSPRVLALLALIGFSMASTGCFVVEEQRVGHNRGYYDGPRHHDDYRYGYGDRYRGDGYGRDGYYRENNRSDISRTNVYRTNVYQTSYPAARRNNGYQANYGGGNRHANYATYGNHNPNNNRRKTVIVRKTRDND